MLAPVLLAPCSMGRRARVVVFLTIRIKIDKIEAFFVQNYVLRMSPSRSLP